MPLGTTWNLPNFAGELYSADPVRTPLLTLIGGMTGGLRTTNREFPTAQLFEYPEARQPGISEAQSAIGHDAEHIERIQKTNVVQIHQEFIDITYDKLSNMGRMSGLNTAGDTANPQDELEWQVTHAGIVRTARDVEHSFILGQYNLATGVNDPNQTRGMIQLCEEDGTNIDAGGAELSYEMLQELYLGMAEAGASFGDMVMMVPARRKQEISSIYAELPGASLPASRTEGGINVSHIMTDFTEMRVIWNPHMPEDTIGLFDISVIAPVFQEVPGKGVFFVEEKASPGASERRHLYGAIGLDHGPGFMHGTITGLG